MANNVRKETRVTSKDSQSNLKYTIDVGLLGISPRTNTNEIRQAHSGTGVAGSAALKRTTVGSPPSKSRCLRWLTIGGLHKAPHYRFLQKVAMKSPARPQRTRAR